MYIYEGENDTGELLQDLTGQIGNGFAINSRGNKIFLRFISDGSESEKGFKIRYEGVLNMNS